MTTPKGEVIAFKCDTRVCKYLPYIDLREHAKCHVMIETIKKTLAEFTKREIECAEQVRAVQRGIGHPADEDLRTIVVSQQSLKNNPTRSADLANSIVILGLSVAGLNWVFHYIEGIPGGSRLR